MPHMVIFRNAEGKSGNHMTESLEDAVRFVEHLRNNESVSDARVFRMEEVQIEFKVLYKVEISNDGPTPAGGGGGGSAAGPTTVTANIPSSVTAAEVPPPPPAPAPAAAPASEPEPAPAAAAAAASATPAAATPPGPEGAAGSDDQTGGRFGLFSRS